MSNFPYNSDQYSISESTNGCPLEFNEFMSLASKIRMWHGCIADTSDWSQQSDNGAEDEINLAFGLMDLLSDPNAIHRLIASGKDVRYNTAILLDTSDNLFSQGSFHAKAKEVIKDFVGENIPYFLKLYKPNMDKKRKK